MYKRDYWSQESLRYSQAHYRLLKCANIINAISQKKSCDLLDVGCGPAILSEFLDKNINYYGIDGFISEPRPNLIQKDLTEHEIEFENKSFDIICAFGFFEYMDNLQRRKLYEINRILKPKGRFMTSFLNFQHRHPLLNPVYNNMISIEGFLTDLRTLFHVNEMYPTSYNWIGSEPRRDWLKRIQLPLKLNIPFFNNVLGVQFIFICSKDH